MPLYILIINLISASVTEKSVFRGVFSDYLSKDSFSEKFDDITTMEKPSEKKLLKLSYKSLFFQKDHIDLQKSNSVADLMINVFKKNSLSPFQEPLPGVQTNKIIKKRRIPVIIKRFHNQKMLKTNDKINKNPGIISSVKNFSNDEKNNTTQVSEITFESSNTLIVPNTICSEIQKPEIKNTGLTNIISDKADSIFDKSIVFKDSVPKKNSSKIKDRQNPTSILTGKYAFKKNPVTSLKISRSHKYSTIPISPLSFSKINIQSNKPCTDSENTQNSSRYSIIIPSEERLTNQSSSDLMEAKIDPVNKGSKASIPTIFDKQRVQKIINRELNTLPANLNVITDIFAEEKTIAASETGDNTCDVCKSKILMNVIYESKLNFIALEHTRIFSEHLWYIRAYIEKFQKNELDFSVFMQNIRTLFHIRSFNEIEKLQQITDQPKICLNHVIKHFPISNFKKTRCLLKLLSAIVRSFDFSDANYNDPADICKNIHIAYKFLNNLIKAHFIGKVYPNSGIINFIDEKWSFLYSKLMGKRNSISFMKYFKINERSKMVLERVLGLYFAEYLVLKAQNLKISFPNQSYSHLLDIARLILFSSFDMDSYMFHASEIQDILYRLFKMREPLFSADSITS